MQFFLLSALFATSIFGSPITPEALASREVLVLHEALAPRDTYPKIETMLSSKPNFINFGSVDPVKDVVGALDQHCNDYECNSEFTVSSRYAATGGTSSKITVSAQGSWVNTADGHNPRDYLIDALKKVVGANIKTHTEHIPATGHGASGIVIEHNALSNSGVTRSVTQQAGFQPVQQGDLSITVTLTSAGKAECSAINGALTALAGAFTGMAAAFFGTIGTAACQAA